MEDLRAGKCVHVTIFSLVPPRGIFHGFTSNPLFFCRPPGSLSFSNSPRNYWLASQARLSARNASCFRGALRREPWNLTRARDIECRQCVAERFLVCLMIFSSKINISREHGLFLCLCNVGIEYAKYMLLFDPLGMKVLRDMVNFQQMELNYTSVALPCALERWLVVRVDRKLWSLISNVDPSVIRVSLFKYTSKVSLLSYRKLWNVFRKELSSVKSWAIEERRLNADLSLFE